MDNASNHAAKTTLARQIALRANRSPIFFYDLTMTTLNRLAAKTDAQLQGPDYLNSDCVVR